MVSSQQRHEIQKRMRDVKDALDDESKTEEDVKERTQRLYQYMYEEGLVPQNV